MKYYRRCLLWAKGAVCALNFYGPGISDAYTPGWCPNCWHISHRVHSFHGWSTSSFVGRSSRICCWASLAKISTSLARLTRCGKEATDSRRIRSRRWKRRSPYSIYLYALCRKLWKFRKEWPFPTNEVVGRGLRILCVAGYLCVYLIRGSLGSEYGTYQFHYFLSTLWLRVFREVRVILEEHFHPIYTQCPWRLKLLIQIQQLLHNWGFRWNVRYVSRSSFPLAAGSVEWFPGSGKTGNCTAVGS